MLAAGAANTWAARHRAGEVPGRWPYGLDLLSLDRPDGDGVVADLRALRHSRHRVPTSRRVTRHLSGRHLGHAGLAWDENVATRMAATGDYARMHSGVIWATDTWSRDPHAVPRATRRALAAMASVWTLSLAQLDAFDGLVPASVTRHYVKFGVDDTFYARRAYPDSPMIFSVGGDRDRDTETLIEAYRLVRTARPGVRLVLQTKRPVRVPQGIELITHLPHRELREMYAAASVVAVATRPNLHVSGMTVALEAQATGRPVVLTRTPGTEDYVKDGITGFLPPVGDAFALADHLISLLSDVDGAAAMGARGRAWVQADLTHAHLADRLRRVVTA